MRLHEIKKSTGLKNKAKRIWRWNASKWNYSGKGHKWQKARSGWGVSPFFEWWQTSIVQQMPKMRGFKRHFKLVDNYNVFNLWNIEKDERINNNMEINKFKLKELGYIKKESDLIKILWNWDLSKNITFIGIDKFSKTAIEKIEKSGSKAN